MGSKPWLKVGSVLLAGMLLCGCQDPPRQNNSTIKMPPPDPAKVTTATSFNGTTNGTSNAPPNSWATNNSVAKPAAPGYTSGVGGSVTGLPSQTPTSFNNSSTLSPTTSTAPNGFNSPMPPLNPSIGSTPPSVPSGFASMPPPSSSAPALSSSVPPVNGPTSPGLPAVNYISTPPSALGPNAGPPARP